MAGVAKWRSWTAPKAASDAFADIVAVRIRRRTTMDGSIERVASTPGQARSGLAREDAMRQYCALVRSLSLSPADGDDRTSPCEDDETGFAPDEPVRRAFGAKSVGRGALAQEAFSRERGAFERRVGFSGRTPSLFVAGGLCGLCGAFCTCLVVSPASIFVKNRPSPGEHARARRLGARSGAAAVRVASKTRALSPRVPTSLLSQRFLFSFCQKTPSIAREGPPFDTSPQNAHGKKKKAEKKKTALPAKARRDVRGGARTRFGGAGRPRRPTTRLAMCDSRWVLGAG